MKNTYYMMNPWWNGVKPITGVARRKYSSLIHDSFDKKSIEIIVGGRRTGKTIILQQAISSLLGRVDARDIFYLQADNNLASKIGLTEHVNNFRSLFRHPINKRIYLFIDEVQGIPGWDAELKSMYDLWNIKIFITGSTSYLIESRGNKLTGRQITTRVTPLGFDEYLDFRGYAPSPAEEYLYAEYLDDYLSEGGYPEVASGKAEPLYMQNLLEDIISRDIVRLFKVKKDIEVKTMLELISAGLGTRTSYNNLAKTSGIMVNTAKKYTGFLEKTFLISTLNKWSWSVKDRVYSQKKFYLADCGFKNALDARKDSGARAENALYNHISGSVSRIGYFAESKRETDFIFETPDGLSAVESKYVDSLEENDERLAGLSLCIGRMKPKKVFVVTRSVEKDFKLGKMKVSAIPLWKVLKNSVREIV